MTAGSGAPSTSSASSSTHRKQTARRTGGMPQNPRYTSQASQPAATASASTSSYASLSSSSTAAGGVDQGPQITYPRTLVSSLRPTIGAYTPHLDTIKKGLQYITDSTTEYEEFFGSPSAKGAGNKDAPSANPTKPTSRSKAALAAHAEREAFSQDPHIHMMENALQLIVDMQRQNEVEKQALDNLASMVSMGAQLPAGDLLGSYEHLIKNETKHQQARLKQELKIRPTPGGVDRELLELRTRVWEIHHGNDPLPSSGATAGDEDEDEDMEIVVMADTGMQSLKCPITTNFLEDPVTSSVCKHSFSKAAILDLIRSRGRGQTPCPVHGCSRPVTAEMLQPNKPLARKVARQIAIQEELSQREDEEYTTLD